MAFIESAPRDPVFYQWHNHINDIFVRHKSTLRPYTREELSLKGINVVEAALNTKVTNVIETFMAEDYSDLSHAPFLRTKRQILVKYEHLGFTPFVYFFKVENATTEIKNVTFRVFLGPKFDDRGNLLGINEQRRLMIELDKFQKRLMPGMNTVPRSVQHSSVTAPRQAKYRTLLEENIERQVDYCTCGWPENLLFPKGNRNGMEFSLFVMCTDYDEDRPDLNPRKIVCTDAISYCGAKDQLYPDKKPMGFPFDRQITARTTAQFLTSNMLFTDVKIKHLGLVTAKEEHVGKMYENAGDFETNY